MGVSERQPPGEERLNITHSDNMDTTSPLMQALRTEHGANTDRGMSDVNTGEMTAVMSYDQVSYLLTVMVTVSVVSILILRKCQHPLPQSPEWSPVPAPTPAVATWRTWSPSPSAWSQGTGSAPLQL